MMNVFNKDTIYIWNITRKDFKPITVYDIEEARKLIIENKKKVIELENDILIIKKNIPKKSKSIKQFLNNLLKKIKMNKITDTTKNPNPEWLGGGNPGAIEAQETAGQRELVNSSQLPIKVNSPYGIDIREKYQSMGILILDRKKDDDALFYDVILPKDWKLTATDHSMWSNLIDDEGKIRANIFYKAAFYDRDAFINFEENEI